MDKVRDNIFVETEYLCNTSFVITSEGIVLIDPPGLKPSEALEWKKEVQKYGDIVYIINTDHHWDHSVGNYFFDGYLIVHEETKKQLLAEGRLEYSKKLMKLIEPKAESLIEEYFIRKPTFTYSDKMNIYLGDEVFELTHISGHTQDETIVYLPKKKLLYSGDNVCTNGIPNLSEASLPKWLETLKWMNGIEIDVLVPGHGCIDTQKSIEKFYSELHCLLDKVKKGIKQGLSRDEIIKVVNYQDPIHARFPAEMSERFEEIRKNSIGKLYDVSINSHP